MPIVTSAAILARREQDERPLAIVHQLELRRERAMKKRFNSSIKQARGQFGSPRMRA
jgi:hypothetical protein